MKKPKGHISGTYDVNLLQREGEELSTYRDSSNKQYPYTTSSYLCDICHVRDKDLETLHGLSDIHKEYYLLKRNVDFTGSATGENDITPEEYCTTMIDSGSGELFNPCRWTPDGLIRVEPVLVYVVSLSTESEENAISSFMKNY